MILGGKVCSIYIYIYVHTHLSLSLSIYIYIYLCLYLCLCLCLYLYLYLFIYIYIYISLSLSLYIYIHARHIFALMLLGQPIATLLSFRSKGGHVGPASKCQSGYRSRQLHPRWWVRSIGGIMWHQFFADGQTQSCQQENQVKSSFPIFVGEKVPPLNSMVHQWFINGLSMLIIKLLNMQVPIDVLFPLVGWLIEGFVYPFNNR